MNENLGCNFYLATHPKLPVFGDKANINNTRQICPIA